jgi:uroporphyrin-III C-methyltransferase/precorrin-2 dehydrogenase/sirohydrochlorin ferrochelatase
MRQGRVRPVDGASEICALIVAHAGQGAQVVRLKSGDPTVFGRLDEEIDALEAAAGIAWSIVPGITAASAAAAQIGQSPDPSRPQFRARFLTGHDMKGFAEHDWRRWRGPARSPRSTWASAARGSSRGG